MRSIIRKDPEEYPETQKKQSVAGSDDLQGSQQHDIIRVSRDQPTAKSLSKHKQSQTQTTPSIQNADCLCGCELAA